MKTLAAAALWAALLSTAQAAETTAASAPEAAAPAPDVEASAPANAPRANVGRLRREDAGFCLYGGLPRGDVKYTSLGNVKTGRQTYGGVTDELPRFVETAKATGADAVVHYNGAQHFGFWPWRLVRPVLTGVPIRFDGPAPDCAASGGVTAEGVMTTNKEPPRR